MWRPRGSPKYTPLVSSRMIMMSRPLTISGLSDEASTSASNTLAGRRLAKRSISLRRRSRPRSGFLLKSAVSHFGPPTEPNSTASASRAFFMASSLSGTPCLSRAAPPTRSSLMSKPIARFLPIQAMILRTSFITSGPIPSPGSTSRLRFDAMMVWSSVDCMACSSETRCHPERSEGPLFRPWTRSLAALGMTLCGCFQFGVRRRCAATAAIRSGDARSRRCPTSSPW